MPTRIRLQRKGKKGQPFYHLVVADGRAPRDGKFIERLGTYNPMTHPATIDINFDRALYWVQVGAQPTDTARSILSHKGVYLKYHLLKGVTKGALTEEQVEEKFQAWLKEKEEKLAKVSKEKELSDKEQAKKQLEYEKKIDEARASELAKKRSTVVVEKQVAKAEESDTLAKDEAPETNASDNNEVVTEPEAEVSEQKVDEEPAKAEEPKAITNIKGAEESSSDEEKKAE
jgi:small subunit ribosomal protein S16